MTTSEVLTPVVYNGAPPAIARNTSERQEFGSLERRSSAELASTAVAAAAKAQIEARYIMAIQRPRDMILVREKLLSECARPGFADVAWYRKPIGGKNDDGTNKTVDGLSIRWAEAFLRCYGNVLPESPVLYDDDERRIVRVSVTDLEVNLTYQKDLTIQKRVERRFANKGQKVFGTRLNSYGNLVHIVEATEDEMNQKESALISKALRQLSERLCPGDLKDECTRRILAVQRGEVLKDLPSAIRKTVDFFSEIGVSVEQLAKYLDHPLDSSTLEEVLELRAVYNGIREKHTTWSETLATQIQSRTQDSEGGEDKEPPAANKAEALKNKFKAAQPPKTENTPPPKAPEQAPATKEAPPQQPAKQSEPATAQGSLLGNEGAPGDIEDELDALRARYFAAVGGDEDSRFMASKNWSEAIPSLEKKSAKQKATILKAAYAFVDAAIADIAKE